MEERIFNEISVTPTTVGAGSCNACMEYYKDGEIARTYNKVTEISVNRLAFRLCDKCKERLMKLLKERK